MKKYTKEELFKMDPVEVYKLVLEKKYIKIFPAGFWQQPEALDNAAKCTKYLIEDILNLSDDELKEQLCIKMFADYSLGGMLQYCFNYSPFNAVECVYPSKFKPWEFKTVSIGYWRDKNHGIEATKWLIEQKLQLSENELRAQLSKKIFLDNCLCGMLQHCFGGSPFEAINAAYPGKFKPWEFKNVVPNRYWQDINNGIEATRWLIEKKLQLSDDELKEQLSIRLFKDNGLNGMLQACFDSSPYGAIEAAYPGKFKKEEFKNCNYMKQI